MIEEDITKKADDEMVRKALIEMHVSEFISLARPDIMTALVDDKNKEVEQLRQRSQRKFDEKGNRICDEQMCDSVTGVAQCVYCGKYVCKEHNYGENERCCYDCSIELTYGKK
jgi:predicted nucleic acid binding AN1-type Zn finger protein